MSFSREWWGSRLVLRARGIIDAGAAARLQQELDDEIDEVWLDSRGGDTREGMMIGRALRERRVIARVPDGALCVGACAEAFLGGLARTIDAGGRIGFTAVPLSDSLSTQTQADRERMAARWAEERADYYIRSGVSRGLLRLQLDVPAPGICWLRDADLRRYNVVNFADPPAATP